MTTITVPINKELELFIEEELSHGERESKAHLVRYALERLREERAFMRIEEARRDIVEGRVYKGDLKKLLKKFE
jgi:Arc/MetJ-type ribon-helix-helix transcriptional regulator